MKKLFSALLALALCLSYVCETARAADKLEDYLDLDPEAWYAQGVRYCLERGLMQGYGNRMLYFEPDKPMTRAQLVMTLWRMSGEPVTGLSMNYRDVPDDIWYTEAVRWAYAEGLMDGVSATLFAPDDVLTREQLAVSLWSYARYLNGFVPELPGRELEKYRDVGSIDGDSLAAMCWACDLGLLYGVRDIDRSSVIVPWASASRATTAVVLMRFCLDMGIE